jgi:hypothetical protein
MTNDQLLAILIGLAVWLIIMYYLISRAVKSGTSDLKTGLKIMKRLMSKKLIKEGFR